MRDVRPLDRFTSIKTKLSIVIVAAVLVATFVVSVTNYVDVRLRYGAVIASVIALLAIRVLARGMTAPLREMSEAAKAMAHGDYTRRVSASSRDEVGELARAFNAMATSLGEVDQLRKDIVANVSHELRTPITALQAGLENMVDGVTRPDADSLRTMLDQTQRLGRLVSQLLDISRLEAGVVPLEPREFKVLGLLEDVARLRPASAVPLRLLADPDLTARADPERFHQVVSNLVENAVRHSPPDGEVLVEARPEGAGVRLEVSDSGPGISEEDRSRVFQRFYRSSGDGGTGIGLSIARWIVDLHGGEIRAERREPNGCRMVVVLP